MTRKGGCACGAIRYELTNSPLIVHACHCHDCQRLTGSAFVTNIWIERKFVDAGRSNPQSFRLKGGTGQPHDVYFCAVCGTYLWGHYHAGGDTLLVRVGTLDDPSPFKPDVHIFTRSKLPWFEVPKGVPAFEAFYKLDDVWSAESLKRLQLNRRAA